ncbi:Guanylate-binding protein 6 [Myotis davidii]|uniref:Guanylate-binding protein 6 n=1 Tax=Myotis davidii TaxID=225400 RepID=L5M4M2_MYODS|nr:Guanylate-binding protein 6 [Myotis davidii]
MMDPICLVENQNNDLIVNPTALEILDKMISQPVVVVAIAVVYQTGKSYLMNCLAGQNHGENPKIQYTNMPREYIRKFFIKRKCFIFERPTNNINLLQHMEEVSENQLECSFQVQTKNFCNYIFTAAKTKALRERIIVTGNPQVALKERNLHDDDMNYEMNVSWDGDLGKAYVDTINSGAVPCLENAVIILAEHENSMAMQKAADHYSQQMAQRVSFPTDTLQELLGLHADCEKEAIAIFMERSFKDDNQAFQKKLEVIGLCIYPSKFLFF